MYADPPLPLALGQPAVMQSCTPLQLLTLDAATAMQQGHLATLPYQLLTSSKQTNMPPLQVRQVGSKLPALLMRHCFSVSAIV